MSLKSSKIQTRTKCVVEGCSTRVCSGVSMHGFPRKDRYPELYQHWVDAVRLNNKTPNWTPLKSNKVCAFHFETVENCRIRVPTVFPNIQQLPSTSEGLNYDEFEDDDELTDGDDVDQMDAYEDSIAAANLVEQDDLSMPYGDTGEADPTLTYEAIIDEDSAVTYDEIEAEYNNIVGDVVSTLTYENVMDDNAEVEYDNCEVNESAMPDQDELEEGTVQYSNIEEEIVYDGAFVDGEDSSIEYQISPEKLGFSHEDLEDNDYCVVVVKPETNERKPATPEKQESIRVSLTDYRNSLLKKSKILSKKRPPKKTKKNGKHVKASRASLKSKKKGLALKSTDSVAASEEIPTASCEVQESGKSRETNCEQSLVELDGQGPSVEELHQCQKEQPIADEEPESQVPLDESQIPELPSDNGKVEVQQTESVKTSPTKPKLQKVSPHKDQQNSKPTERLDAEPKVVNGVVIDDLLLDGEPIKLKECFVNIVKTPTKKSNSKKKTSETKGTKTTEKDELSSECARQDAKKDEDKGSESSSDVLNALSLRHTEDGTSGLRRSARIKAGGGKKRKLSTRGSWSVAFKESPKKKRRERIYAEPQSPDSIPYDLGNEDDPDVELTDLEQDDSSEYEGGDTDVSSVSVRKPKPSVNGFRPRTRNKRLFYGREIRDRIHGGYCRIRSGDQATQVGLPGSCDGFIFDVVRDDPCNVGISCNIFYHYQPKNWKPSWARADYVDPPATSKTKNGVRPRNKNQSNCVTVKRTENTKSFKNTAKEQKSLYDKSCQNPSSSTSNKNCTHVSVGVDTRHLENIDSGLMMDGGEAYPGDIVIKVEPAMVSPPVSVTSSLAENTEVQIDSINSMAAAALAELDIKEEEDCHDHAGVLSNQQSCIVTNLCEVSHHGGSIEGENTSPEEAESLARITNVHSLSGSEVAACSEEPAIGIDVNRHKDCAEPSSALSVVDVEEVAIPDDAGSLRRSESSIQESTDAGPLPVDECTIIEIDDHGDCAGPSSVRTIVDSEVNLGTIHGSLCVLGNERSDGQNDPAVSSSIPGRSAQDIADKSITADSLVKTIDPPNSALPTESQTKADGSEVMDTGDHDKPQLTDAMADCCLSPQPTDITDTGNVKAHMDSISAQCVNDHEDVCSISSDTDSLVEVSIPSEPDIVEPLMIPVDICAESPNKTCSANPEETSELRLPSADNTNKNPSADAKILGNTPNSHISKSPAEDHNISEQHRGNPQQVFDNIERKLEKMFDMDR